MKKPTRLAAEPKSGVIPVDLFLFVALTATERTLFKTAGTTVGKVGKHHFREIPPARRRTNGICRRRGSASSLPDV